MRRTGSAMAQYWREVKESKGVRIVLTEGRPEDLAHIEYAGFLTRNAQYMAQGRIRRYFQNILQFVPRRLIGTLRGEQGRVRGAFLGDPTFSFTPWRGLHFVALDLPAAYFGGLKQGKLTIKRPTMLTSFLAGLAVIVPLYMVFDASYIKGLENNRTEIVLEHRGEYQRMIESDWRFNYIKDLRDAGRYTEQQAMEEAFNLQFAYNQYYSYRNAKDSSLTVEEARGLSEHLLFAHLQRLFSDGVREIPGFEVPNQALGPLKDQQIVEITSHNQLLYLKYQILDEIFLLGKGSSLPQLLEASADLHRQHDSIVSDGFYQTVRRLEASGRITAETAKYLLQQDFWWQTRFAEWDVLGIKPLRGGESGQYTTLNDIRNGLLQEAGIR
ncbi:MAG: hypothetical protein H6624_00010 [Bdellovibrionaceae bacterium]|nr:hypothetical protein [Pseudobdellovibrionaceae bacterium]